MITINKKEEGEFILNSKRRAYLRGQAMTMDCIIHVGKSGVTPEITESIREALEARELIKINVLKNCLDDVSSVASMLGDRTQSEVITVIGRKIVLFKQAKENSKYEE